MCMTFISKLKVFICRQYTCAEVSRLSPLSNTCVSMVASTMGFSEPLLSNDALRVDSLSQRVGHNLIITSILCGFYMA